MPKVKLPKPPEDGWRDTPVDAPDRCSKCDGWGVSWRDRETHIASKGGLTKRRDHFLVTCERCTGKGRC